MIKVMKEQFNVTDTYPNHTLSAEWDIIAEMKATLAKEELGNNIQFTHIKGHADKDKSYHKLTTQQQLNVDADKLAGEYIQQHYNDEYGIVPLLPTSGAQLNMEEGTVTHQIKRTVMQARSKRDHKAYLCQKNAWTPTKFNTINWESHRQALNRIPKKRTILVKYLNNIAPVGKMVNKYDPKYTAGCPSCPAECETQEHMLQCPCVKREEWRLKFVQSIQEILDDYQTPLTIKQLMIEGLQHSFGDQEPASQNVNPTVTTIATAQATIGWSQLMKGRFALEWQIAQQDAMQTKSTKHKNAQTWSTQIIQTIFEKWLELWRLRNEDHHGRDWHEQRIATKEQAIREVEMLYTYKGKILPTDEWIFNLTLEQQKLKTAYVLRAFVSNYKPVIMGSYQTRLETG
jgi:hypothetical protein